MNVYADKCNHVQPYGDWCNDVRTGADWSKQVLTAQLMIAVGAAGQFDLRAKEQEKNQANILFLMVTYPPQMQNPCRTRVVTSNQRQPN